MYGGQKGGGILGVPSGNAAPLLQMQESILDKMPEAIEICIILSLYLPVLFGWNHNLHTQSLCQINKFVCVIRFVTEQIIRSYSFNKLAGLSTIRCGTRCNKYSDRITMRIHGQMYF